MLESMRLKCIECDHIFDDLIERSERDNQHPCPVCGERAAIRIMAVPYIRTSDSASHLDGSRKFHKLRESWALRKAKAQAKERRDRQEEKRLASEITKVNEKG